MRVVWGLALVATLAPAPAQRASPAVAPIPAVAAVPAVTPIPTVAPMPSDALASDPSDTFVPLPSNRLSRLPVVLVPGWFDTARDLAALRLRMLGSGWSEAELETLTFADPRGSNRDHADELAGAIRAVLERTGRDSVDVVAHSMGGLATRWYLLRHDDAPVRRVVFIGSPHRGTLSAHLAWGGGREEMMPDSPFLDTLNAAEPVPLGVDVITIRTRIDTHIVPGESATLPGVPDHELCCPTHAGLLHDEEVYTIVRSFLEGGRSAIPGILEGGPSPGTGW